MPKEKSISFEASFDPNKQVLTIRGDGSAKITLETDATNLTKVIQSFALYTNTLIEVTFKRLPNATRKQAEKEAEVVR